MHVSARKNFSYFAENNVKRVTSSFVLVETASLLRNRIGLPPVNDFNARILPLLEIVWADEKYYAKAVHVQRLAALNNRHVGLVDVLSFEIMDALQVETAFAFDNHFEENGFRIAAFD